MHASVMEFVARAVERYNLAEQSVLDVGSFDVNGSPRHLFERLYVGIDMRSGPGVDHVVDAHDLSRFRHFDVIVCTEVLEHDDAPWVSLREMHSACRHGGLLILTARGYDERGCFGVHGYPGDHWRFSLTGVESLLDYTGWTVLELEKDPEAPGVFAVATA